MSNLKGVLIITLFFLNIGCQSLKEVAPDITTNLKIEIEWDKSYGGNMNDVPKCMTKTKDGGLIIGGVSNTEFGNGNKQSYYFG